MIRDASAHTRVCSGPRQRSRESGSAAIPRLPSITDSFSHGRNPSTRPAGEAKPCIRWPHIGIRESVLTNCKGALLLIGGTRSHPTSNHSPLDAHALFGNEDLFADAEAVCLHQQAFDWFFESLVAEREGPVVHGDEDFRA